MAKGKRTGGRGWVVTLLFLTLVLADQALKVWVKTHMFKTESIRFTDWFYLLFIENNGMAFGMEFLNKWFLTGFRLVAVVALLWYIWRLVQRRAPWGYLVCLTMVTAGALGNLIDCMFYGLIFNNPPQPVVAEWVSFGTGYSTWMQGRVVDMFYFPLYAWTWPEWMPLVGGQSEVFFSPIFNFADASISCGIAALLLFYRKRLLH